MVAPVIIPVFRPLITYLKHFHSPQESMKSTQAIPVVATVKLEGRITSISIDAASIRTQPVSLVSGKTKGGSPETQCIPPPSSVLVYIGTAGGNMYQAVLNLLRPEIHHQIVQTSHASAVTAVAFPQKYSEVCRQLLTLSYQVSHVLVIYHCF
jgi:hypothetical protein